MKRFLDGGESEYFFSEYETSIPIPGEGGRGKEEMRVLREGELEEKMLMGEELGEKTGEEHKYGKHRHRRNK